MDPAPRRSSQDAEPRWLSVALLGALAVAGGIILPRLLPFSLPASVSAEKAGTTQPQPKIQTASQRTAQAPGPGGKLVGPKDWTYVPPSWPEPPDHHAMFIRLGAGTLAVLALCAGSLWFGKRWFRGATAAASTPSQLRLVESLPLGNRCVIHLVNIGANSVLIGTDAGGVKTVVPLAESFAQTLLAADATPAPDNLRAELTRRYEQGP
jgi:flagellar biogenesis protein FliO